MGLPESFAQWSGMPPHVAAMLEEKGWSIVPYSQDGEVRAIAALSGTEIHFAIAPEFRNQVIAKQRTRDFLAPLMEARGFLTTRTEPNEVVHNFLIRLGFSFTLHEAGLDHYMLSGLPWGKEH